MIKKVNFCITEYSRTVLKPNSFFIQNLFLLVKNVCLAKFLKQNPLKKWYFKPQGNRIKKIKLYGTSKNFKLEYYFASYTTFTKMFSITWKNFCEHM